MKLSQKWERVFDLAVFGGKCLMVLALCGALIAILLGGHPA